MPDSVNEHDFLPPHSDLGASGMERWSHCPASFGLSQREYHRAPTIYAATGTVAHDLVERTLRAVLKGDDATRLLRDVEGEVVHVDGHAVTIDADLTSGVHVMLSYLIKRSVELGVKPLVEQTVFVDDWFPLGEPPPVRMFGRADAQFRCDNILEIVDYKNGSGVIVDVVNNPQLLYYAAGALMAMNDAKDPLCALPAWVLLTVVQPNARGQDKIRTFRLTTIDVMMWVNDTLIPAVRACESPQAEFHMGPWCRFCPVAHACPELIKDAQLAARLQFDDSAEADVVQDRLNLAENVMLWAEAMRGFALERIRQGLRVPGWGEVPTRPRREWTDPDTVGKMLVANGFNPFETKLSSPAQVEKRAGASSSAWRLVEPYVRSKSSGTKLARTDDADGDLFEQIHDAG